MSLRVFVALPIPAHVCERMVVAARKLEQYRGLKIVDPRNLHITLHFFGEKNDDEVAKLSELMEDSRLAVGAIPSSLCGFGQFPEKGNPRVIFARFREGIERIASLQRVYQDIVSSHGFHVEREQKPFVPHVTLARNKRERLTAAYARELGTLSEDFAFDRLVLYRSILKSGGPEYIPIKTTVLSGGSADAGC